MRIKEFYHSQDVRDAEWLIQTNEQLDHGLSSMAWAWRVIAWYLDLYKHVRSQVISLKVTVRAALDNTLRLVKLGIVEFGVDLT
jgi:hypothetical protein